MEKSCLAWATGCSHYEARCAGSCFYLLNTVFQLLAGNSARNNINLHLWYAFADLRGCVSRYGIAAAGSCQGRGWERHKWRCQCCQYKYFFHAERSPPFINLVCHRKQLYMIGLHNDSENVYQHNYIAKKSEMFVADDGSWIILLIVVGYRSWQ